MPQPDLVFLLVWVRETAANVHTDGTNPNAQAANGDKHPTTLSPAINGDPDEDCHCDDDGYLDAHLGGYEHGHSATLVLEHGLAGFTDQASGQEGQSANPAHPVLTPDLKAGLAALASVDDDADGLTNTQEQWWCTGSWSLTLKSS